MARVHSLLLRAARRRAFLLPHQSSKFELGETTFIQHPVESGEARRGCVLRGDCERVGLATVLVTTPPLLCRALHPCRHHGAVQRACGVAGLCLHVRAELGLWVGGCGRARAPLPALASTEAPPALLQVPVPVPRPQPLLLNAAPRRRRRGAAAAGRRRARATLAHRRRRAQVVGRGCAAEGGGGVPGWLGCPALACS